MIIAFKAQSKIGSIKNDARRRARIRIGRVNPPSAAPSTSTGCLHGRFVCGAHSINISGLTLEASTEIPRSFFQADQRLQFCQINISDLDFGGQIPSPTIEVSLYSSK